MNAEERKTALARHFHDQHALNHCPHWTNGALCVREAEALAPLVEQWIAEHTAELQAYIDRQPYPSDVDDAYARGRRDGAAAVVARVEAAAGADLTNSEGVRRLYCDPARLAAALASDTEEPTP